MYHEQIWLLMDFSKFLLLLTGTSISLIYGQMGHSGIDVSLIIVHIQMYILYSFYICVKISKA